MKFFLRFLKYNFSTLLMFAVMVSVCSGFMCLYNVPAKGTLYFIMIMCIVFCIYFFSYYIKARNKCKKLQRILNDTNILIDKLPKNDQVYDFYYNKIIKKLCDKYIESNQNHKLSMDNTINYYSLWVHQIKTPIASMKLKLQNQDSDFSRNIKQDLNNIERYVNMVMTYLRLNSGSTDFVFKKQNLNSIVKPIIKNFSSDFIYKKINLDFKPLNIDVTTDEKWLAFVVEQIISNAIKYTKEGTISIYADVDTLIIKDTGIGISDEDLPRIFEKGFTGNNGRYEKQASGIGLYLCKQTCDNLKHELNIESTINKGTTVKIRFQKDLELY